MVEGKGFVYLHALSIRYFVAATLQNAANCCVTCARALSKKRDFQLQARQSLPVILGMVDLQESSEESEHEGRSENESPVNGYSRPGFNSASA